MDFKVYLFNKMKKFLKEIASRDTPPPLDDDVYSICEQMIEIEEELHTILLKKKKEILSKKTKKNEDEIEDKIKLLSSEKSKEIIFYFISNSTIENLLTRANSLFYEGCSTSYFFKSYILHFIDVFVYAVDEKINNFKEFVENEE